MNTVINNPGDNQPPILVQPSGAGPIVALVIAVVVIILFFIYGLPFIRSMQNTKDNGIDVNVKLPAGSIPTPPSGSNTTPAPTP